MASNNDAKETLRNENNDAKETLRNEGNFDSMRNENNDLIEYVQSLDNSSTKTVENFIKKLGTNINYQELLNRFNWSPEYFAELDTMLINIGYCGRDDIIGLIKEFLRSKIRNTGVIKYNSLMNAGIWNHLEFLRDHGLIKWDYLSCNPAAIDILTANPDKIVWHNLSGNTAAIDLLKMNQDKIDWHSLSGNTAAIDLLKMNQDKITWINLSGNDAGVDLLKMNPDKIHWGVLSKNSAAMDMIKANRHLIDWYWMSQNTNPEAIQILAENVNNINWHQLSENPAAIELLKAHPDKIDWYSLSNNTAAKELIEENKNTRTAEFEYGPGRGVWFETQNIYNRLKWPLLSSNPAAIELIKKEINSLLKNKLSYSIFKLTGIQNTNIHMDHLLLNPYDYYDEKLMHFNGAGLFPQSHLEL